MGDRKPRFRYGPSVTLSVSYSCDGCVWNHLSHNEKLCHEPSVIEKNGEPQFLAGIQASKCPYLQEASDAGS